MEARQKKRGGGGGKKFPPILVRENVAPNPLNRSSTRTSLLLLNEDERRWVNRAAPFQPERRGGIERNSAILSNGAVHTRGGNGKKGRWRGGKN